MHPNAKDLTGRVFGKLTALTPTGERRDNKIVWACACACGGQKTVGSSALTRGVVRSCGCARSDVRRKWKPGDRFGRLTLRGYTGSRTAEFVCDCGTVKVHQVSNVSKGQAKSCGCLRNELRTTHALSGHPLYRRWSAMVYRCRNPKHGSFRHYGGRGITVCDRWLSFENFLADMGAPPTSAHTVERENVNGPYAPENCRWATQREQLRNRRSARRVAVDSMTVSELEELLAAKRALSAP